MKRLTPDQIRNATLQKSLRGFDETATRELLTEVAALVQNLTAERDGLRQELEEARATAHSSVDSVAIGNALITAQHAAQNLIAEAEEAASRIGSEARVQADGILEQARRKAAEIEDALSEHRAEAEREHRRLRAELSSLEETVEAERQAALTRVRAEADGQVAEAQDRLTALRAEQGALQEFIEDHRRRFVDMLESTLAQIDRLPDIIPAEEVGADGLATLLANRAGVARDTQLTSDGEPETTLRADAEPPDA